MGDVQINSFEEWLAYVFDHPYDPMLPEWYFRPEAKFWDELAEPAVTVGYMTRLFTNAFDLCAPYSDAQVNRGLWFVVHNGCSSHAFALADERVPFPARLAGFQSMYDVYEKLFARRCTPHLSHRDEPGRGELNSACYMWWDLLPVAGDPKTREGRQINAACLDVMEKTLELDSIACQEGALHGLGHWCSQYRNEVERIIKRFLTRHPNLRPELKIYAQSAKSGCIL